MTPSSIQSLRSIALVGHGAAGKTSLAEALLAAAGTIPAAGTLARGSTVSDFDPQEKEAGHSLYASVLNLTHDGAHLQLIDTPGYPDFVGAALPALAAVDTALIVINAQTGVELMSERMMRWAEARRLCRMIVINKIDAEPIDLPALVADLRARFGKACLLLDLPAHGAADVVEVLDHTSGDADFASVQQAHRELIDQLVEEDESLLAQYLEDGTDPSPESLHAPFEKALREGHLIPILFVSARTGAGVRELLHVLSTLAPNPAEGNPPRFFRKPPEGAAAEPFDARPDPNAHVLAHVFKVIADPYMGKVGVFRVHQGTVRTGMQLLIGDATRPFKVAHLYRLQGKAYTEVSQLLPGEIGAVAKIDEIAFDAVLHDSHDEDAIYLQPLEFPRPMSGLAVETRRKSDEQRLFDVLGKLASEDPSFVVERHPSSNETVIRGLGEVHLKSILARLASQYKLELDTRPPAIPYRETITAHGEAQYRHKKQSGGAGQFGEVHLRIEPLSRGAGFRFIDAVKGGAIPGNFMGAVEKGVRQALEGGVVAGYPVEDIQVTVFDGKTHSVDGKDIAFTVAARKATQQAIRAAQAIVLEPIVEIRISAPESSIGDLTGDLAGRRGHITGTDARSHGMAVITGEVPLAEINDYESTVKSRTAGRGSYRIEFARYAPLPATLQQQLSARFKLAEDDE